MNILDRVLRIETKQQELIKSVDQLKRELLGSECKGAHPGVPGTNLDKIKDLQLNPRGLEAMRSYYANHYLNPNPYRGM